MSKVNDDDDLPPCPSTVQASRNVRFPLRALSYFGPISRNHGDAKHNWLAIGVAAKDNEELEKVKQILTLCQYNDESGVKPISSNNLPPGNEYTSAMKWETSGNFAGPNPNPTVGWAVQMCISQGHGEMLFVEHKNNLLAGGACSLWRSSADDRLT